MLQIFLADRDVPCPACGYNIRQLQKDTCPECGRPLRLTIGIVGLSNIWIATLLGAIVPAACGLPFHILLLFAFSQGLALGDITSDPTGIVFLLLIVYTLCCVPISITLLAARRNFIRLGFKVQRTVASSLIAAAIIAGVIALVLVGSLV